MDVAATDSNSPGGRYRGSQVHSVSQLVHQAAHFVYTTFSDQCGGRNPTKQFLGSKDELSGFVRLIEVRKLIDDEFKLQKRFLGICMRICSPLIPSGDGFRPRAEYISNIGILQRTFLSNGL